jgi:hypothetical protein
MHLEETGMHPINPNDSLTVLAKEACRELVSQHFPRELGMFEEIWDSFFKCLGVTSVEELDQPVILNRLSDPVRVLGAAAGGAGCDIESLVSITVFATASAILSRRPANQQEDKTVIEKVLRTEAKRAGVPDYIRAILDTDGAALLAKIYRARALALADDSAATNDGEKKARKATRTASDIYLIIKEVGALPNSESPEPCDASKIPPKEQLDTFHIVVDEVVHRHVRFRNQSEPKIIVDIQSEIHKTMLWLVLTQVVIKENEIKSYRAPKWGSADVTDLLLRKYAGLFREWSGCAWLLTPARGKYEVRHDKFSFCWIRADVDPEESVLLHPRHGQPPEKP